MFDELAEELLDLRVTEKGSPAVGNAYAAFPLCIAIILCCSCSKGKIAVAVETVERPLLKPWYRLSAESGRSVLRYAGSVLEFEGAAAERLLPHLLPLLDGTRTVDDVVGGAGRSASARRSSTRSPSCARTTCSPSRSPPASRRAGARSCSRRRRVTRCAERPRAPRSAEACIVRQRPRRRAARAHPAGERRARRGAARLGRRATRRARRRRSLEAELPRLEEWNERALDARATWMQVLPFDGRFAAVGPVFVPGQTACHECYRWRRDSTIAPAPDRTTGALPRRACARRRARRPRRARRRPAAHTRRCGRRRRPPRRRARARAALHAALRLPRSALPGLLSGQRDAQRPHRGATLPLETLVSPLVGVVRGTQEAFAGPEDARLPAVWCESAFPQRSSAAVSGLLLRDARAAAIGEAVERYSASIVDPDACVVATARELGPSAVDPRASRSSRTASTRRPGFPYVRFDVDTRLAWVAGVSLPGPHARVAARAARSPRRPRARAAALPHDEQRARVSGERRGARRCAHCSSCSSATPS